MGGRHGQGDPAPEHRQPWPDGLVWRVGGQPGESTVTLMMNGKLLKAQRVSLQAGESIELDTVVIPGIEGTYIITTGDLKGRLVVNMPAAEAQPTDYWWILLIALGGSILILLGLYWKLMTMGNK